MPTPIPTSPRHLVALLAQGDAVPPAEALAPWADALAAWLAGLATPASELQDWLVELDTIGRAAAVDSVLSPVFAAALPALETSVAAIGTPLRLMAGDLAADRFPGSVASALADGQLTALEGDAIAVVDAWLAGRLAPRDADALTRAVRGEGVWRTVYTQAIRSLASVVRGGLYTDRCMHVVAGTEAHAHAQPLLDVPLPHRGTRLRVYAHDTGGTLWTHGEVRRIVPGGNGFCRWKDPVLGYLDSSTERFEVSPLDEAREAAVSGRHLAMLPDHARRARSLAKFLEETVSEWLGAAHQLFVQGQDTEALREEPNFAAYDAQFMPVGVLDKLSSSIVDAQVEEVLALIAEPLNPDQARAWVLTAIDLRMALDRYCADHPSHALINALADADAVCEPHRIALLWLTQDEVIELMGPEDVATSSDWWGFYEALEARMPRHLLTDALASLEAE